MNLKTKIVLKFDFFFTEILFLLGNIIIFEY